MDKLFKGIGTLIERNPARTLLTAIVIFALLIAGVSNMKMSTGNETLVQGDNDVYLSNKAMEKSFGGDSVLILFTDKTEGNLLSLENMEKMWNVEQRFSYEENIFSIMSPASLVHQMADKQSTELIKQVLTLSAFGDESGAVAMDVGVGVSPRGCDVRPCRACPSRQKHSTSSSPVRTASPKG